MKIPASRELAIKKAILKAVENNVSPAKLADNFGVSKSTIYKYRRELAEQGFIQKNENDIYIISPNKFSIKPSNIPKTADLKLSYKSEKILNLEDNKYIHIKDHHIQNTDGHVDAEPEECEEVEVKILKKKQNFIPPEEPSIENKGLFKNFLDKFKKKKS